MEKTPVIKLLILHTPKKSDKEKNYLNLGGKAFLPADKVTLQSFSYSYLIVLAPTVYHHYFPEQ